MHFHAFPCLHKNTCGYLFLFRMCVRMHVWASMTSTMWYKLLLLLLHDDSPRAQPPSSLPTISPPKYLPAQSFLEAVPSSPTLTLTVNIQQFCFCAFPACLSLLLQQAETQLLSQAIKVNRHTHTHKYMDMLHTECTCR